MIAAEGPARLPAAVHGEAERLAALVPSPGDPAHASLVPSPGDPAHASLASLSPKGRQTMTERLRAVAALLAVDGGVPVPWEALPWHELRFTHIAAVRACLQERGAAPATVNLTLAALRGVARYARNLDLLGAKEYDHIRDVRGARGSRLTAGRAATHGELAALVRACLADRTPAGIHDAALLAVLYAGWARDTGRYPPGTPVAIDAP